MTKKNYKRAAELVKELSDKAEWTAAIELLLTFFAEDNPRFDRERFMEACGYKTLPELNHDNVKVFDVK